MLQKQWTISRLWKNAAGGTEAIEFSIDFSAEQFPGASSRHAGTIPLPHILASGSREALIEGILAFYGAQWDQIEAFHRDNLAFQHLRSQHEEILVDQLPLTSADVDRERDRRIDSGFLFADVHYQTRLEDRENIAGASVAALEAIMNGAEPGDLRWHGESTDFCWIAEDNSIHPMDAQTVFEFGKAAMAHKKAHIFSARAIKDMNEIPADFADDSYWP